MSHTCVSLSSNIIDKSVNEESKMYKLHTVMKRRLTLYEASYDLRDKH